jgi:hypothetical protein
MPATKLPGSESSPPAASGNAAVRGDGTGSWLSRCMEWVLALHDRDGGEAGLAGPLRRLVGLGALGAIGVEFGWDERSLLHEM